MSRMWMTVPTLTIALAWAGVAWTASPSDAPEPPALDPATNVDDGPPLRHAQMNEDVSIMGELLHESMRELYGRSEAIRRAHSFPHDYAVAAESLAGDGLTSPMGVYLQDFGVVYQMALPGVTEAKDQEPEATDPPTNSAWDRARKRVRERNFSHKDVVERWNIQCSACHAPADRVRNQVALDGSFEYNDEILKGLPRVELVVGQVVDLLAENGQHLDQLKPEEKIVVQLDFDTQPIVASNESSLTVEHSVPFLSDIPTIGQLFKRTAEESSRNDQEILGDLHMRQGSYADAAKEYKAAFESYIKVIDERDRRFQDEDFRRAYFKCVQALVGQGKVEAAMDMLEAAKARANTQKTSAAQTTVRGRLDEVVLTVTHDQTRQLAKGLITPAEFKRRIQIELRRH